VNQIVDEQAPAEKLFLRLLVMVAQNDCIHRYSCYGLGVNRSQLF
jgi:hypothetical protein